MRRFKLINAVGAEWDLVQRDGFFHAPAGLGYQRQISTLRAGTDWLVSDEFLKQKTASGQMVFRTYAQYHAFVAFITKDEPLWLMYNPDGKWYRCRCKVQRLDKGEMSAPGLMTCAIQFLCLGTWFEALTAQQTEPIEGAGKVYSYPYPYTYAGTIIAVAEIANGDLDSPCKLHIFGPVVNPFWALTKAGERILTGRVNVTIPEGNKLVVNASASDMEIAEYTRDNNYVRDCYAYSDFSTERFVYAPPGISSVSVTSEDASAVRAVLEVEKVAYSV